MTKLGMSFAIFLSISLVALVHGSDSHKFRGRALQALSAATAERAEESRGNLRELLHLIISGSGPDNGRMEFIELSMMATYRSLPKTAAGGLSPRSVRHLLRSYFAKEHGWTVVGLDRTEQLMSSVGSAAVLQNSAPALMEAVLEAHEHGQGLSLEEVAALARAVEKLAMDEAVDILSAAYAMNGLRDDQDLSAKQLREILVSFLAVYHNMTPEDNNVSSHLAWKQGSYAHNALDVEAEFAGDSLKNFEFASLPRRPFTASKHSFATAAHIVDGMAYKMGRWHHESCAAMKGVLESLDKTGTGRVPWEDFHNYNTADLDVFNFDETMEELRSHGLLDESVPGKPAVRIANYVLSPTNCESMSQYYNSCCPTACDGIMNQIEEKILAPTAEAGVLEAVVLNISLSGDEDIGLATSPLLGSQGRRLRESLRMIASQHDGVVPLHGRLFATWMHFAFPRDCPLPSPEDSSSSPSFSVDSLKQVAPSSMVDELDLYMPSNDTTWVQEQDLALLSEIRFSRRGHAAHSTEWLLAILGVCAAVVHVVRVAVQYYRTVVSASSGNSFKACPGKYKKNDDLVLPFF